MTTIVSRGIEHVITLRADRLAQRITVEHTERPVPVKPGAAITITWPGDIHLGEVIEESFTATPCSTGTPASGWSGRATSTGPPDRGEGH